MKQTTEKIRSLHIQMVAMIEHLRDKLPDNIRTEEARILYDAHSDVGDAAQNLFSVLRRLDRLQKGVDSIG